MENRSLSRDVVTVKDTIDELVAEIENLEVEKSNLQDMVTALEFEQLQNKLDDKEDEN